MNNQRRNVLKSGSGAALLTVLAAAGIIKPGRPVIMGRVPARAACKCRPA